MRFIAAARCHRSVPEVFEALSDFAAWELRARKRGLGIARIAPPEGPGGGMAWQIGLRRKAGGRAGQVDAGQMHAGQMHLVRCDAPHLLRLRGAASGLQMRSQITVQRAEGGGTELTIAVSLRAQNLRGRLLMPALRLARGRIARRLEAGLHSFAEALDCRDARGSEPARIGGIHA